jgi:hypothetical protein
MRIVSLSLTWPFVAAWGIVCVLLAIAILVMTLTA